jgi:hypothetical protein
MVKDAKLKDWLTKNETTILAELVMNHSPRDLAYVILHPDKWDDAAVLKLKRLIDADDGTLKKEKLARKRVAKTAPPKKVKETVAEADERLKSEKAAATEKRIANKAKQKADGFELPE